MTPEELKITPETVANRFAMVRFRTPHTSPDGMDSKEFFDFLLEDIKIVARQQAILFAEWIGDGSWKKHPDIEDMWYVPAESIDEQPEQKTTDQLYTIFQEQNKSKT